MDPEANIALLPDSEIAEGSTLTLDGSGSFDTDGTIISWDWTFGDGSFASGEVVEHVYADNGLYEISLLVMDNDGLQDIATTDATVTNVAPTVSVPSALTINEGGLASMSGISVIDPGFDSPTAGTSEEFTVNIDWGEGTVEAVVAGEIPGSPGMSTIVTIPTLTHVYGDNGVFDVTLNVCDDDGGCGVGTTTVTVNNVVPQIQTTAPSLVAGLTLRLAGEKWHEISLTLYENGEVFAEGGITRMPGSPDDQAFSLEDVSINLLDDAFTAVIEYTPLDDPINGQVWGDDPAWLIMTLEDGTETRLHHNFNVRHPETWLWVVEDFSTSLVGVPLVFDASAFDVGSDDLTFTWSWDDLSPDTIQLFYNDGVAPDPFPSPAVNPMTIDVITEHTFGTTGSFEIELIVEDDDGGSSSEKFILNI